MNLQQSEKGNDIAKEQTINDLILSVLPLRQNPNIITKANANVNATTNTNEGN